MAIFRHIGITVINLEKELYFYRDILGFEIKREMLESGVFIDNLSALEGVKVKTVKMSTHDGSLIELLCYESHKCQKNSGDICDAGYSHVAFTVEDIDREYKRLRQKGVKFNYPPQVSADGKAKVAFCRDPEGNLIELVEEIEC